MNEKINYLFPVVVVLLAVIVATSLILKYNKEEKFDSSYLKFVLAFVQSTPDENNKLSNQWLQSSISLKVIDSCYNRNIAAISTCITRFIRKIRKSIVDPGTKLIILSEGEKSGLILNAVGQKNMSDDISALVF